MLKKYLEQRHIDLDSGRSCLALEREYWQALEVLAYEDGWRPSVCILKLSTFQSFTITIKNINIV